MTDFHKLKASRLVTRIDAGLRRDKMVALKLTPNEQQQAWRRPQTASGRFSPAARIRVL
jgi:hypothetical protein